MPPLIVAMIPYDDERDLGRAHNAAMEMLPEDGWGLYAYSRLFCRRCERTFEEPYPFQQLADYNGRVGQGIVHTPEFAARMAIQQRYFDEQMWTEP